MFDDFFTRALVTGIGIAIITGPLGCLVIWRRLSYFGDTLAHSALLGVTLAYAFSLNIAFSVFIISAVIALLLLNLQKRTRLAGDSLLGLLAHSTLAIGLVLIGFLSLFALASSTFFERDKSTKGPFFSDLGILLLTSSSYNKVISSLIFSCLITFCRNSPWC